MTAVEKYESFPITTNEEVRARDDWYQETFLMMRAALGVEEFTSFKKFMKPTTEVEFLDAYLALYDENFEGAPL